VISEIDGVAEVSRADGESMVKITSSESYLDEYPVPPGAQLVVSDGQSISAGGIIFSLPETAEETLPAVSHGEAEQYQGAVARVAGQVITEEGRVSIRYEERDEREYSVPHGAHLLVRSEDKVKAGDRLTRGPIDPHDILRIMGKHAVQRYMMSLLSGC
jgi:DNA-directed RNA polymerase subunit beta'